MTKPRVLVVDDDEIHRYALTKSLEQGNCATYTADNGASALVSAAEFKPDLVLLDIHLPDMDGYAVCSKLKENPDTRSIPIIIHSAVADTAEAQGYARDAGAVSFLSYPVEIAHLLTVIKGAIARSGSPAAGKKTPPKDS